MEVVKVKWRIQARMKMVNEVEQTFWGEGEEEWEKWEKWEKWEEEMAVVEGVLT